LDLTSESSLRDEQPVAVPDTEGAAGFVSPWMVPEVEDDLSDEVVDFDEPASAEEEAPEDDEVSEPASSRLGPSTGLAPNARLVEGLQASAFRPTEDPKKRRRRKR
jgi:hypothetical protein